MSAWIRNQVLGALSPIMRYSTRNKVRILMYHRFDEVGDDRKLSVDVFEEQIKYLKKNYHIVPLSHVVSALERGERLPEKTVAITVDDGYADFASCAYPVLRRYGVPATLYVVSDFVDQKIWLWFDMLHFIVFSAEPGVHCVHTLGQNYTAELNEAYSRSCFWEELADALIAKSPETKDREIASLSRQMRVSMPPLPSACYRALNWKDIAEMEPELVEIGSHTVSHPILSTCDFDRQRFEIEQSKRRIEEMIGRRVVHFCYPNGQRGDYSDDTVRLVEELGFESAVLAHGGFLRVQPNLFMLERMGTPFTRRDFVKCIDGVWHLRERLTGVTQ